ncbi:MULTISPECIES: hypothetical protein [unclassified Mycoplasma]|uniref:hypothetical protein n=1 Tax=unclassified Mycoplasma TaxID=2683645 RepID=UPI00211B9FDE|nr:MULTISPECIES: hypothetical protein [unclassified Mycoplasma]UUM20050.1 hypothetical protein NPA11_01320 [Mycoplasma sp. 1578d]UUM25030.1 hypothetical protein NPA12_01295 [Mycoplasma sp. 3686d]
MNKKEIKINEHELCDKIIKTANKKYLKSYYIFVFLNMVLIFITAASIILNLFAIRYNPFPEKTMIYFILLSCISVIIAFLSSVQTFLSIKDQKDSMSNNIQIKIQILDKLNSNEAITREEIDNMFNTL